MKKILKLLSVSFAFVGLTSCDESMLELKNENQYNFETYFLAPAQFNEAVIATYAVLNHKGMFSRDYYFMADLMGNEAHPDAPLLGDVLQFHDFSFGANNALINDNWESLYRMVFRANLVLDRAEKWNPATAADQNLKKQYIAEAAFLRAFANFYLVNLYGRVPMRPNFNSSLVYNAPRSSEADLWTAIEKDLALAITDLPVSYTATEYGRATRGAAVALLGKAFLYQKKYPQAQTELLKLTAAPYNYALAANYDDLFKENINTRENVWWITHREWRSAAEGGIFYMFNNQEATAGRATHSGRAMEYGWNDWRNVFISKAAVDAFSYNDESNQKYIDPRARLTFYGDAASGGDTDFCHGCAPITRTPLPSYAKDNRTPGPFPYPFNAANGYRYRKYELYEVRERETNPISGINTQVIRYADVLLMLAESYIEQGNAAAALPFINQVRKRSGAFEYKALGSQDNARSVIRRERQIELCGEQVRWFDLKRWGIAQQVINAEKQAAINRQPFQPRNVLLPIPQREKDTNADVAKDVKEEWN
jgi:hypothetical protein